MVINKTYRRKTFTVQAIQVTVDNMKGLAEWCGGNVIVYFPDISRQSGDYRAGQTCVEVVIGRVNGREQKARAYPGDWITKLNDADDFRVYRDKTFLQAFEEVRSEIEKRVAVMDLLTEFSIDSREAMNQAEFSEVFDRITDKILTIIS